MRSAVAGLPPVLLLSHSPCPLPLGQAKACVDGAQLALPGPEGEQGAGEDEKASHTDLLAPTLQVVTGHLLARCPLLCGETPQVPDGAAFLPLQMDFPFCLPKYKYSTFIYRSFYSFIIFCRTRQSARHWDQQGTKWIKPLPSRDSHFGVWVVGV